MIKGWMYAALVAGWLLSVVAVGGWQRHDGALAQASKDQARFDQIAADIAKQKADATAIISRNAADLAALYQERDEFKTKLEEQDAKHKSDTAARAAQYAHLRLRFQSAQSSGCGPSGTGAVSKTPSPAVSSAPAECVIPDAIAASLRQLTNDADTLSDNYRLCYQFVKESK